MISFIFESLLYAHRMILEFFFSVFQVFVKALELLHHRRKGALSYLWSILYCNTCVPSRLIYDWGPYIYVGLVDHLVFNKADCLCFRLPVILWNTVGLGELCPPAAETEFVVSVAAGLARANIVASYAICWFKSVRHSFS